MPSITCRASARVGDRDLKGWADLAYPGICQSAKAVDQNDHKWMAESDFAHAWTDDGHAFRTDARFADLATRIGILDYWKQYGFPDNCRATQDKPIVCS